MWPSPFFCQNWHIIFTVEKAVHKFGLLAYFTKKTAKEKKRPMGENSLNLVTLND
jgi:hypothetical protein